MSQYICVICVITDLSSAIKKKEETRTYYLDRNSVTAPLLQFFVVTHLCHAICTLVGPYSNSPAFALVVSP